MPIDPKYIVTLQGKEHVLYAGLLNEAHERGLGSIETELIQAPSAQNEYVAIAKARVKMYQGIGAEERSDKPPEYRLFEEYGDASPRNVNSKIASALIRMALTRAKGRALRDAVNIGETMAEELPPEGEESAPPPRPATAAKAPAGHAAADPSPRAGLIASVRYAYGAAVKSGALGAGSEPEWDALDDDSLRAIQESYRDLIRGRSGAVAMTTTKPAVQGTMPHVCAEEGCGAILTAGQAAVSMKNLGAYFCPSHQKGKVRS